MFAEFGCAELKVLDVTISPIYINRETPWQSCQAVGLMFLRSRVRVQAVTTSSQVRYLRSLEIGARTTKFSALINTLGKCSVGGV
jgi:hypothetical protein